MKKTARTELRSRLVLTGVALRLLLSFYGQGHCSAWWTTVTSVFVDESWSFTRFHEMLIQEQLGFDKYRQGLVSFKPLLYELLRLFCGPLTNTPKMQLFAFVALTSLVDLAIAAMLRAVTRQLLRQPANEVSPATFANPDAVMFCYFLSPTSIIPAALGSMQSLAYLFPLASLWLALSVKSNRSPYKVALVATMALALYVGPPHLLLLCGPLGIAAAHSANPLKIRKRSFGLIWLLYTATALLATLLLHNVAARIADSWTIVNVGTIRMLGDYSWPPNLGMHWFMASVSHAKFRWFFQVFRNAR